VEHPIVAYEIKDAKDQITKAYILTYYAPSDCGHIGFWPYVQANTTTLHKETDHERDDDAQHKKSDANGPAQANHSSYEIGIIIASVGSIAQSNSYTRNGQDHCGGYEMQWFSPTEEGN